MILFDVIFSGAEPEVDAEFAAVMKAARNVMLPFAFVSGKLDAGADVYRPPQAALLPPGTAPRGPVLSKDSWSINKPDASLSAANYGSGTNLWTPDADGVTRRLPLSVDYDGKTWATFWWAAASKLRTTPPTMPVDANGNYVVRWKGDTLHAYRHIPLWEMVCSIYSDQCDTAAPRHPAAEFRDKILFVGATAAGSYEVRPTGISETAPGVFVLATALDNLLHEDAVKRAPEWLTVLLIASLAGLPAWSIVVHRSMVTTLAFTGGALAIYAAACYAAYAQALWLPMSAPMLGLALSFTGNTAFRYLSVDRELSRTRGALERYVSPQLVRYVMDNLENFRFDGEKKRLTIFFSDIRGFTTLTEKSDPAVLLKQLNEYLEAMTEIIFKYDGIVDKFIGDGIMAHWGAFTPNRQNARLAAAASLEMLVKLGELNTHWAAIDRPALDIGIGLHTAEVIFGNIGTGRKVDFTCIGDGVNLSARLESANKEYKTKIIISAETRNEIGAGAQVRSLGSVVVKGKTRGVDIYELLGLE